MDLNYIVIAIVVILAVILIVFIIARNRKDQKKLEKEINESETKPEKHDVPKV